MLCKITITDELLEKLNEVSESMDLDLDYERVIDQLIENWSGGN